MAQAITAMPADGQNILDRFPWYAQLGILLALVFVLWFAVRYFFVSPMIDEAATKRQEVEQLKIQNQEADIVRQNIEEFKKTLAGYNEQFESLKYKLPEESQRSLIFDGIKQMIERNDLRLASFATGAGGGKGAGKGGDESKDYYTETKAAVGVLGPYRKVQALFRDIANYDRILNVTDINLTKANENEQLSGLTTKATFTVTGFYISEANKKALEEASKPPAPDPKGKKGADKKGADKKGADAKGTNTNAKK
jgi:Tfp pilus assembly protein PilO